MARVSSIALLPLLLSLGACETTGASMRFFGAFDKLGDSVRRHLGPTEVMNRTGHRLQNIGAWTNPPRAVFDPGALPNSLTATGKRIAEQTAAAPVATRDFVASTVDGATERLAKLADPEPGWPRIVDLNQPGRRLRNIADHWEDVLSLRRQPLSSMTDLHHRTSPLDNRPVESWGERVLRRLGF